MRLPDDSTINIDSEDQGRQAIAALKGYRHQLYATALAWARLPGQGALLVEVAEDYATVVGQCLRAVQVKSGDKRPTLHALSSVDFINAYWRLRTANPDRKVEAVYLSTAEPARERGIDFPGRITGIDYWRIAARESADVGPIRRALAGVGLEPSLAAWLTTVSDDDLRSALLRPVKWECGAHDTDELDALLLDAILDAGETRGFYESDAQRAKDALLIHLLGISTNPGARRLRRVDFLAILERATAVSMPIASVRQSFARAGTPRISGAVDVADIPQSDDTLARTQVCAEISGQLAVQGAVWLHGGTGVGKTHLALEVARSSNRRWRWVGLRGLEGEALGRRLAEARLAADTPEFGGLILDDVPDGRLNEVALDLAILSEAVRRADGGLICTSYRPPPLGLSLGRFTPASFAAPYLSQDDVNELVAKAGGEPDVWGVLIRAFAGGGHPQLVAARIAGLKARNWPESQRLAGIGSSEPPEGIEAQQEAARLRLVHDLPSQAAELLYRTTVCVGAFDRQMALAIGRAPPPVGAPGPSLDLLIGPWIETLGRDRYRASPLVADGATANLGAQEIDAVHLAIIEDIIARRPIPGEYLGQLLVSSLRLKHRRGLSIVAVATMRVEHEERNYLARDLFVLALLNTERPIVEGDPDLSVTLRLAQLRVAIFAETSNVASVLSVFLNECKSVAHAGEFRSAGLGSVLTSANNLLSPAQWLPLMAELPHAPLAEGEAGSPWSPRQLAFNWRAINLRSIARLVELFESLDRQGPEVRTYYLSGLREPGIGVRAMIQSSWVDDAKLPNFDARGAASTFHRLGEIAERWGEHALQIECVGSEAVLLSEYAHDHAGALAILDAAVVRWPEEPRLVRETSKILLNTQDYAGALARLRILSERITPTDFIDNVYVFRELAVAAANLSEFETAISGFDRARASALRISTLTAKSIGLLADRALVEFRMGRRADAVRTLHAALVEADQLDPAAPRSEFIRRAMGHLMQWIINTIEPDEAPESFTDTAYGVCSRDPPEYEWPTPVMPIEGLWYQLEELEAALNESVSLSPIVEARVEGRRSDIFEIRRAMRAVRRAVAAGGVTAFVNALPSFCLSQAHLVKHGRGGVEANVFQLQGETSWSGLRYDLSDSHQRKVALEVSIGFLAIRRLGEGRDVTGELIQHLRANSATEPLAGLLAGAVPAEGGSETERLQVIEDLSILAGDDAINADELYRVSFRAWGWLHSALVAKEASPAFAKRIAARWTWVLEHARFSLRQPNRTAAPIAAICTQPPSYGQIARLLLAAEPAAHVSLGQPTRRMLAEAGAAAGP